MGVVLDVGVGSLFGLLQALAALVMVAALAWLARRLVLQQRSGRANATLRVEERLPLDMRGSLVIVRAEDRRFLLATGERGPARLIAELASAPPQEPGKPRASAGDAGE